MLDRFISSNLGLFTQLSSDWYVTTIPAKQFMTKTSQAIPYIYTVIRLSNIRKPSYKGDSTLPRQNKQFIFTITDVVYM